LKFGGQDKDKRAPDTVSASQTVSEEVDTTTENDLVACQQMLHSTDAEIIDQITTSPVEADDDDDDSCHSQEVAICKELMD